MRNSWQPTQAPIRQLPLGVMLGSALFAEPDGGAGVAADRELRLLAAAKLVELRRASVVAAAQVAGMSVWEFVEALARMGVHVPSGGTQGPN